VASKTNEQEEELVLEEAEGGAAEEWVEEDSRDDGEEGEKVVGDVRNNSAWGHRWFLSFGRVGVEEEKEENLKREVE